MGTDAGDVDGDGRLDLWVTTYEGEDKTLYRNRGDGGFDEVGRTGGLDPLRPLVSWGTLLEDFDNDGILDVAVVSGHVVTGKQDPRNPYRQLPRMFRGLGKGRFQDVSAGAGPAFSLPMAGRGMACGDYDGDGRVDLAVVDLEGRARLLRNDSRAGGWLAARVLTREGRPALGARVRLDAGAGPQVREVRTARGASAAAAPDVHFCLGERTGPLRREVRWPGGETPPEPWWSFALKRRGLNFFCENAAVRKEQGWGRINVL